MDAGGLLTEGEDRGEGISMTHFLLKMHLENEHLLMEKIFFVSHWVKKNNRLQRQKVTIIAFLSHEKLIGFTTYWLNINVQLFSRQ